MILHYVVLAYADNVVAPPSHDIAVVVRPFTSSTVSQLRLYTAPGWMNGTSVADREYIQDVFDELIALSPDEALHTFTLLCNMSSGCLRARAQGTCDHLDLERIVGPPIF